MSLELILEKLALLWFFIGFIGILWIPLTWLLLSIFTPKSLLEKYFKEPYFSLHEMIFMAQFPGFLIRTGIFGWVILLPSLDKKRNIRGIIHDMPRWYKVSLNFFVIGSMLTGGLFLLLMGLLLLMSFLENYGFI